MLKEELDLLLKDLLSKTEVEEQLQIVEQIQTGFTENEKDDYKEKYDNLKAQYMERFFNGKDTEKVKEVEKEKEIEPEEIQIKDILKSKEDK